MKRDTYDKQLIKWAQNHYWDSLEKDRDLILRHLRSFAGEIPQQANKPDRAITCGCDGFYQLFGVHRPGCRHVFDE